MPEPRRILIVRPSALGDVCRTVPVLVTLRRAYPDALIHWLVHTYYIDAVRHHPALNDVVPFQRDRWWAAAQLARSLRKNRYDLVIDLQGLARSGWFTFLTGAPQRVGYANAHELAWLGYNRRFTVDRQLHTVDRMLALVEAHGVAPAHDMTLYVGDDDRAWAESNFAEPFICIAPTAKWRCKCWPIERFVEIAGVLRDRGRRVVALAAPHEHAYVRPLVKAGVDWPETNVARLSALIARCDLLICNDSAPLHIAAGFNKPIVTLFGPTDPALVGPYRRAETIVQPDNITADDMLNYRRRRDDQSLIARIDVDTVRHRVEANL